MVLVILCLILVPELVLQVSSSCQRGIMKLFALISLQPITAVTRKEIIKRGLENRMKMIAGDFAELNEQVPGSDTVVMDRVVCCYPLFRPLLESAVQHSQRLFAYSYPHDRWYIKLVFAISDLLRKIRGQEFRTFIHPQKEMEQIITSAGFRKLKHTGTMIWSIDLFQRVTT